MHFFHFRFYLFLIISFMHFYIKQWKMWTSQLGAATEHTYSSEPSEWPFMDRNIVYWVDSITNVSSILLETLLRRPFHLPQTCSGFCCNQCKAQCHFSLFSVHVCVHTHPHRNECRITDTILKISRTNIFKYSVCAHLIYGPLLNVSPYSAEISFAEITYI